MKCQHDEPEECARARWGPQLFRVSTEDGWERFVCSEHVGSCATSALVFATRAIVELKEEK